jgi:hypothetical protein
MSGETRRRHRTVVSQQLIATGGTMSAPSGSSRRVLLQLIRERTELNGLRFVVAECVLAGAVGILIALGGGLGLTIGAGIALNMTSLALVAVHQHLHRERTQPGPWKVFNPRDHASRIRKHPQLRHRAALLTATCLVPFCLTILILAPWPASRK